MMHGENVPIIHHEHHNLGETKQQFGKFRNGVVLVVHSRKVNHIQTIHFPVQIVENRNSGALSVSSPVFNLR